MFGTLRLILAAMVVFSHFGGVKVGGDAVFMFFTLSGFLMTLLMDTAYKGRVGAFALNRALRLYPHYWLVLAATILFIEIGGPVAAGAMGMPSSPELMWDVLYLTGPDGPQLVLTAWAVANEILMFALIAMGISKTPMRSYIWFGLSLAYVFCCHAFEVDPRALYYFPLAASLPFSIGAMAYHHRNIVRPEYAGLVAAISTPVVLIIVFGNAVAGTVGRMALSMITALMVLGLFNLKSPKFRKTDSFLGSLSYPIYLNHFLAASILLWLVPEMQTGRYYAIAATLQNGAVVLAISIGLAIATSLVVDGVVNKLRSGIRNNSLAKQPKIEAYPP